MTPEEIFNNQVWDVLQDIEGEKLATVKGKPVKYWIPDAIGGGIVPKDRKIKILYKLEEKQAFKILRNPKGQRIGRADLFYLVINPQKFNEVYEEFHQLVDKLKSLTVEELKTKTKITNELPNKREMAKEVTRLIKVCSLGKKEAILLRILSNFEPKRTRELTNDVPTKDYKHLKYSLAKKIIKEGWGIKTQKGQGLNPASFYTLVRAPLIEN